MTEFEKALMNRDELTEEEAHAELEQAQADAADIVADGDYDAMEELLMDYGLEMDYLFDVLGL